MDNDGAAGPRATRDPRIGATPEPERVDVRVAHSRGSLKAALRTLLRTHSPDEISISQLCKAAGLSRPTFYQHFSSVDDVFAAIVRDQLDVESRRMRDRAKDEDAPGDPLELTLSYIQKHREHLVVALDSRHALPQARSAAMDWMCEEVAMGTYGTEFGSLDGHRRARVIFVVGGITTTLEAELRNPATTEVIASELTPLIRDAIRAVLLPGHPRP